MIGLRIAILSLVVAIASVGVAVWAVLDTQDIKIANDRQTPLPVDLMAPQPVGLKFNEKCPVGTGSDTESIDRLALMSVTAKRSRIDDTKLRVLVTWWNTMTMEYPNNGLYINGPMGRQDEVDASVSGVDDKLPKQGACGSWYRYIFPVAVENNTVIMEEVWPEQIYCFGVNLKDEYSFQLNGQQNRVATRCKKMPKLAEATS
ncbi:hypothetical protein DFR72_114239 [Lentzea flaviverrucosa]|uniref:Uncharacterized protein n=2 Tax=Lentzea flaviverrucosa TaxID=200379 RepID=A0A1H9X017_9PSEU|nr:hypothetical protein DFR72_114239 [Lentzea flaviverrucosa]SES39496.1 hypothetical protein SAMN05216195_11349 [Lentzea flaviverrucosa]